MSQHTPGPWMWDRDQLGELALWKPANDYCDYDRHLLHGDSPIPLEEREANAQLMAVAPEMFDIVEAIVGLLGDERNLTKAERHLLEGARLVLAKIGGDS